MKKHEVVRIGFLLIVVAFLLSGCKKDDSQELKDQEMRILQQYLVDNNITQEPTASGLYYIPIIEGTGTQVEKSFIADINFTIELIDGTVLSTTNEDLAKDNNLDFAGVLYGPIRTLVGNTGRPGLDEGMALMREGGKADMILPSDINGFGGSSTVLSPAYSTHLYTVEMIAAFDDPVEFQTEQILSYLFDHEIDSFFITESGLHYIEIVPGEGELIKNGDKAEIWYTGSFLDGRIFDSNLDDFVMEVQIPADGYIEAWDEAIKLMRKGGIAKFIVPYELAYGETGRLPIIPPYKTLVFDMEIDTVISKK